MSAPVSVIIPTLNAAPALAPTLAALVPGVADGLVRELIFADGGSSDDIAALADGVGAELITASRGRGQQLRAGAAAAQGEWLLFVHADTVLSTGWVDAARRHMETAHDKAAVFRLAFDVRSGAARRVAGWANWRTRAFGLPYGDQGLLITRALYEANGGYPPLPLMEDVALARALGRRRIALLDAEAVTSAERYVREGWTRRGARNLWTLMRYLAGADPARLAEQYRRTAP